MFGLMHPENQSARHACNDCRYQRMHYCGVCKTLGRQYGHRARVLLNFDTVFLAEILSHLSKENPAKWQGALQAINRCLTMPVGELPLSLQFAAAANVLLGALKLDDQIKDAPGLRWKLARHFFSGSFRKADSRFRDWGLDTCFLWHWVEQQDTREKSGKTSFASLGTLTEYYAEPTAQMTGWIFKHGATVAGQAGQAEAMYNLGYQFGRLAYSLDAFEDLEKDLSSHQFNPLARFFNAKVTLSSFQFEQVRQLILQYREAVERQLAELPLSAENVSHYALRLHAGVGLRLYKERPEHRTLPEQFQLARKAANNLAERMVLHPASILRTANHYLVSFIVLALPLAADMVSYNHREVTYKWITVFTAVLGGMGLLLYARKQRKKRRLKAIKRKLGVRLFFRRIKKLFSKGPECCEDCASACCTACIGACAEVCCQVICDALYEKITSSEKGAKVFKWIVIVAAVLILASMIAF